MNQQRFFSLNTYCKEKFHEKIYRLSIDGGMTCPNRDGSLSRGGCIFCSAQGSGDFAVSQMKSVTEQLQLAKLPIQAKTNCKKFIAYFQSFTNTYGDVAYLEKIFFEAISSEDVVVLAIATRSDCLGDDVLNLLDRLNRIKPVWIELGLQTIHNTTHQKLNTMTTLQQFEAAVTKLQQRNIQVVAHVILGLPGESKEQMLETIKYLSHSPVWGIKLQLLHILKGTVLASQYEQQPFPVFEMEEYCNLVVDCIELLRPDQVLHRLTGDGPKELLIAPLWSTNKKAVLNKIHSLFAQRNTYQGIKYTPK